MRTLTVASLMFATVAVGAAWAAESLGTPSITVVSTPLTEEQMRNLLGVPAPLPQPQDDAAGLRKPILRAAGTQAVGKGEERITIPVDGVAYEVVVTKPGLGAMIPLEH